MALTTNTKLGHALPPAPRHAITVHFPLWSNLVRWVEGDAEVPKLLKSMYPRMMLHRDVKELISHVLEKAGNPEGRSCLLFSDPEAAIACREFALSSFPGKEGIDVGEVSIRPFDYCVRLYAVFFPASKTPSIQPFWAHSGRGISSRLAETCLEKLDLLQEDPEGSVRLEIEESVAHSQIRERIATLLKRAPIGAPRGNQMSPDDIYLFPTGMAAIYAVHSCLLQKNAGTTVLFGFPFRSTGYLFENVGPGCKLLGLGNFQELQELGELLQRGKTEGERSTIQAIWTEFPANPMLSSANLKALRKLADEYSIPLIIDDTIGSFCNVDVLGVADVLVTSLTKTFSGYADVMGGSVVLNPSSKRYAEFKSMFKHYRNDYWKGDAEVLEQNSQDYLTRSSILNSNAARLVEYLQNYVANPDSTLSQIYYPTVNPDRAKYEAFMRPKTEAFAPGYGCLFTLEFEHLDAAIAFYDNLSVYNGPHLGAHLTLAMAYVKGLYNNQLDWASKYGLKEAQIRISVGLEEYKLLQSTFEIGMRAADATKMRA